MKTLFRTLAVMLLFSIAAVSQTFSSAYDALGYNWKGTILSGNSSTSGSQSIVVMGATNGSGPLLPNSQTIAWSTVFFSLTPILINDANAEYMTPTSTSIGPCPSGNVGVGSGTTCVTITGTFANTHGQSAVVQDGTGGLQTALNVAQLAGGGQVSIGPAWAGATNPNTSVTGGPASLNLVITGLVPMPLAGIIDYRASAPVFWNLQPTTTSFLAAPSALTSSTVFSSSSVSCTPSGSCFAGGTIHAGYECVDLMGNPGPISADYSFTDTSAKAVQFTAPPAQTSCLGYIPVLGLESGAANNEYEVPLVTQPTAIGGPEVSNGVCTLSTIVTSRPVCAITNSTYGQTGSGAVVVAYPVVTSPQTFQLGGVSSTSYYAPNTIAHTTYGYAPGAHPGNAGLISQTGPATVSAALASTVPFVLGTVQIPWGFMNYQGREIQICGFVTDAATAVDTISAIQFWWDAQGSNVTTGIPVKLANDQITATLTAAVNTEFCQNFVTTVPSASATGGTIQAPYGWIAEGQIAAGTIHFMEPNITIAAVGSLNLAENAQIDVVFVETTSTVDTPKLQNLTVTVLN
jgi:hypothetical protein